MVFLTIKHFHAMILFKSCRMETKDDLAVSDLTETVGLNVTTKTLRQAHVHCHCATLIRKTYSKLYMETLESLEAASCK